MARLSGLPSEHHHEGPGDAPRRKRGRPNKTQAASQSQSQETASIGKRTASPSAELSQTKRTKRAQASDEDQLQMDMDMDMNMEQSLAARRNGRRHSEPPVAAQDEPEDELAINVLPPSSTQPASTSTSGLTPHLNRIGAARQHFPTMRRARMSMPAQLHIERVDEEIDGTQFQYAPLTAVLDSRTRRRLRRSHLSQEVNEFQDHQKKDKKLLLELRQLLRTQDAKIKDLEYQLEARRLGEIDMSEDHAEELAHELDQARHEIEALRASSLYNGSDRELSAFDGVGDMSQDEDEHMLLVNPDELNLSQDLHIHHTPDGKYASRVQELSSQMTFESLPQLSQLTHDTLLEVDEDVVADRIEDQAVERYERELQHYVRILAESQGALRLLALELQNLHFVDTGHSSTEIIVELRHGFDKLRLEVDKFFPSSTTNLTNQELLHKIPELFSGLFFELKEKIALISMSQKTEVTLRRQYEGVLDLLGDSEERVQELEQKSYSLDKSNEEKQRSIIHLDEHVIKLTDLTTEQEAIIKDKDAHMNSLQDELGDKDTALERLREALESYRKDLATVTQTATTFESEHHEMIAQMEQEHSDAIRALQADLELMQDAREAAEGDAQQKGEIIDELESRIENMEREIDQINGGMTEVARRLADQTKAREAAEAQRDEQAEMAYEYSNTIDNMKAAIAGLKTQVDEFRTNLSSERSQREQTEAALDEASEKIEDLNGHIRDLGIQAQELRSKLFELQQQKEQAIADLQDEAKEREDELIERLANETQLRKTADKTVSRLDKQITLLESDLATADSDLTSMSEARQQLEQDREQQAANLNQQLADLKAKYTALETSTNSTITSLQANITDLNNQVHRQQAEIKRLNEDIADKHRLYEQDTSLLKEEIAELKADLADERAENEKNHKEIVSLSQRVEDEANELLNMVNSHDHEINSLKTAISTHEATINTLQANAAQRTEEYEELLVERTREIEEMQMLGTARVETITILQSQIEDLKSRFVKQEEDTRVTIDALNLAHRRLLDENDALAAALKKRNADTLKAVQEMKVTNVAVKTQGVDLHRVQTGKIVKTAEKVKVGKKGSKKKMSTRSWRDSGMGLDEDESLTKVDGDDIIHEDFLAA